MQTTSSVDFDSHVSICGLSLKSLSRRMASECDRVPAWYSQLTQFPLDPHLLTPRLLEYQLTVCLGISCCSY